MGLRSQLFRGDAKLEAAAVSDPAHIMPGAVGPHVTKIQLALIQLDGAAIAPDSVYGPATAAAVLAYKRKRDIVNRTYQTQADNIVGKMTMASLDAEMFSLEAALAGPPRIEPVSPPPRLDFRAPGIPPRRTGPMLGFKIGGDTELQAPPQIVVPGGPSLNMEIPKNGIGSFRVMHGVGGTVGCWDASIGLVFDPAEPLAHGGTMRVARDPHLFNVRGIRSGTTFIEARLGSTLAVGHMVTLVVSCEHVASNGTPIKPKGGGRRINIWGQGEAPQFEDYAADPQHAEYTQGGKTVVRPVTSDPARPPGLGDRTASDICIRDSPISQTTISEVRRIAQSGCRLTVALHAENLNENDPGGPNAQLKKVRDAFPNAKVLEDCSIGGRKVLVIEIP